MSKLQLDKAGGAKFEPATILDEGPWALTDLPQLFREMHPNVLASAWAAILLDSLLESGLRNAADVARAFNHVAITLHHRPGKTFKASVAGS